jgi:glycosyltransferase involved in cell wall biosynthesis
MIDIQSSPIAGEFDDSRAKVAVICHSHPSITKGGAEVAAYALFRGLREIGVDAIFIGACEYSDRHRLALADTDEFAVYYDRERYDHFYHLSSPDVERQLVQIVGDQRVTAVSFHHFMTLGLNSLRAVQALPGVSCFFTIHEFLAICHNHGQMVTRDANLLCSQATNAACMECFPNHSRSEFSMRKDTILGVLASFNGFIAPSRFLADRFIKWGLPGERVIAIENGLLGCAPYQRKAKTDSVWTFGYFGQINPFKGVDLILEVIERIAADEELAARLRLRIHGNFVGQPDTFVKRFQETLQSASFAKYLGPYSSSSVYRLMSECDYLLVPSNWWENSPVVIQEAYSVRTPVICTGIGGLAEKVLEGVSGLHFSRGDSTDLLRAMTTGADPKVAESLRAGIPDVATASDMARSYFRFFASGSKSARMRPHLIDSAR